MDHIKVARWTYYTGNFIDNTVNLGLLCCLWGIFKNRHLSNATGRIRDESLMNLGGRALPTVGCKKKTGNKNFPNVNLILSICQLIV
jgi:hypothetical protein